MSSALPQRRSIIVGHSDHAEEEGRIDCSEIVAVRLPDEPVGSSELSGGPFPSHATDGLKSRERIETAARNHSHDCHSGTRTNLVSRPDAFHSATSRSSPRQQMPCGETNRPARHWLGAMGYLAACSGSSF